MSNQELIDSSKTGDLEKVKTLVEGGANIHVCNDYAVRLASENGHLEVVKYLVEQQGANIRACYDYALRYASYNGHLEVVKYLYDKGADIHTCNNDAVCCASYNGHLEVVKYLVEQGADIHACNDYALCCASQNGHLEVVMYLVEQGADIHAEDNYALCCASQNGRSKVVEYLKSLGCGKIIYPVKPEGFQFRDCKECPITHEQLTDEMEKIGCSQCKNVFNKEALKNWFDRQGKKCPFRCENAEFYEV